MTQGDQRQVDVHSPDGSVRIRASTHGDVDVEVRGLHLHSDDSLARQVRAAARLALAVLQQTSQRDPARPWAPG